jgi:hypothetical protein
MYNTTTGTWSTDALSEPRAFMGFAVAGTKAIFAGGFDLTAMTNRVDIYDFVTRQWTIDYLSLARGFVSATAVGNKVIIAGGMTAPDIASDRVDIYDVTTGTWSTSNLSAPRGFMSNAASACGKAFFAGGGNFDYTLQSWTSFTDIVDIYDAANDSWSIDFLSHASVNHGVVANGDQVFVAGGTDILTSFDNVDIFTCITVGIKEVNAKRTFYSVYPNPAFDYVTIAFEEDLNDATVILSDMNGKIVYTNNASLGQSFDVNTEGLLAGVYILQIQAGNLLETHKVIVSR